MNSKRVEYLIEKHLTGWEIKYYLKGGNGEVSASLIEFLEKVEKTAQLWTNIKGENT